VGHPPGALTTPYGSFTIKLIALLNQASGLSLLEPAIARVGALL
jgi:hypothetical protein